MFIYVKRIWLSAGKKALWLYLSEIQSQEALREGLRLTFPVQEDAFPNHTTICIRNHMQQYGKAWIEPLTTCRDTEMNSQSLPSRC